MLLRRYDQGLVEVLFHLAAPAEAAWGVGQRAHCHQRHVAQLGLLEGEGNGGLSGWGTVRAQQDTSFFKVSLRCAGGC
jgi:hypothetical protein